MTGFRMNTAEQYRQHCESLALKLRQHADPQLKAIARELAEACLRGNRACIACGGVAYFGALEHNEGCPVARLRELVGNG